MYSIHKWAKPSLMLRGREITLKFWIVGTPSLRINSFSETVNRLAVSLSLNLTHNEKMLRIFRFGAFSLSAAQIAKFHSVCKGPFLLKSKITWSPRFNGRRTVLCFPFFEGFVIPTFGLYDFAGVRVFVNLHLARLKVTALDSTTGARRRPILWI